MNINNKIKFFERYDPLSSILIICLINTIYFILSYDNPWTLDDFGLIFPVKLFNLINNHNFTFQTFIFSTMRRRIKNILDKSF